MSQSSISGGSGGGGGGGSTSPAGSTGQLQFNDGSSNFDASSNLVWDDTNDRLGIGSSSPSTKLHLAATEPTIRLEDTNDSLDFDIRVDGNGFNIREASDSDAYRFVINGSTGNCGIGTSSPNTNVKLEVAGPIRSSSTSRIEADVLNNGANSANIIHRSGTNTLVGNGNYLYVTDAGNVGISTSSPSKPLHVVGEARFDGTSGAENVFINSGAADSDAYLWFMEDGTSKVAVYHDASADALVLKGDSSTDTLTVKGSNVGIGTSVPSSKLHLIGEGLMGNATNKLASYGILELSRAGDPYLFLRNTNSQGVGNSGFIEFYQKNGNGSEVATSRIGGSTEATHATQPSGNLKFYTASSGGSLSERMRIDSSGRVGIGTVSPSTDLHISAAAPKIRLQDSNETNVYTEIFSESGDTFFRSRDGSSNGIFTFNGNNGTSDTEFLRISSSGKLGVGSTSPTGLVHLKGDFGTTETAGLYISNGGTATADDVSPIAFTTRSSGWGIKHAATIAAGTTSTADGGAYLTFKTSTTGQYDPTERMRITSSGTVEVNTPSSGTAFVANLLDNTAAGFIVRQGGNGYLSVDTTNSSESIEIGNTATNPETHILGGNCGIGTTSPSEVLTLNSASNTRLLLQEGGSSKGQISAGGSGLYIQNLAGDILFRNIAGSDTVTFKDGGNVGIGETSPSSIVHASQSTGLNFQANSRAFFGSLHSTHFAVLGCAVKADDGTTSQMVSTETSSGNGRPSAIQLGAGNIDFHTAASSTAGAAFDSLRMRIASTGRVTVKKSSNAEVVNQSSGTCDLSTSNNFKVTMSGSITINLTNGTTGQSGVVKIISDGSAINFTSSQIKWAGGTVPTPSSTSGAVDILAYYVDGSDIYGQYLTGMA